MQKAKPILILTIIGILLLIVIALLSRYNDVRQYKQITKYNEKIPQGWTLPPIEKTTRWPHKHRNRADEILEDLPPGTSVVEVEKTQVCAILPNGNIVTPEGLNVIVYKKPPRWISYAPRPWIGAGVTASTTAIRPVGAAGVDFLHIGTFHTGPGFCVAPRAVSGLLTGSYGVFRNVDVRAGGGYGNAGFIGFIGVDIAIQ